MAFNDENFLKVKIFITSTCCYNFHKTFKLYTNFHPKTTQTSPKFA